MRRAKFLLWEAQYIFGKDVCCLLKKLQENLYGTMQYYQVMDNMAAGNQPEDYEMISRLMAEHYRPLQGLVADLLADDNSKNLNFYFHKYLTDSSFRKPLLSLLCIRR